MDGSSTDLVLKELKRIKWLLVLIVLALLSLPASLLYIGWEIATFLQDNQAEQDEGTVETTAEDLLRPRRFDELGEWIDRRARNDPQDARTLLYRDRLAADRRHPSQALRTLEPTDQSGAASPTYEATAGER